ncbi:MAG: bifunctional DNA-formamidopyrimidine glycosylase/DNA-(apurinic or apyrimidinic site) lyase [Acidobacteriaceae bacterium]
MPELPEVETVANGVNERVRGDRIEEAWFGEKPEPLKTPAPEMAAELEGRRIEGVRRVGKHIVFDLETPVGRVQVQWIVHLGMTGRLLVTDAESPRAPHTHGVLRLSSGRELRFVDARRFGRMALHRVAAPVETELAASGGDRAGFRGPGREPLLIEPKAFIELFRGRRVAIKAALLNQKLLQGVGNIYADESLFRAGIRPRKAAARLTRKELRRLHAAVNSVLRTAIERGGSSVSDYVDAAGAKGFFQLEHRVYMRTGQPCLVCGTPIRRLVVAGRGTHYCPVCQK